MTWTRLLMDSLLAAPKGLIFIREPDPTPAVSNGVVCAPSSWVCCGGAQGGSSGRIGCEDGQPTMWWVVLDSAWWFGHTEREGPQVLRSRQTEE